MPLQKRYLGRHGGAVDIVGDVRRLDKIKALQVRQVVPSRALLDRHLEVMRSMSRLVDFLLACVQSPHIVSAPTTHTAEYGH